jgi:outer membrane protein assembly factor BamB
MRARSFLPFIATALIVTTGCGSSAVPSPVGSAGPPATVPAASVPPTVTSAPGSGAPSAAPVADPGGDWLGFRGDASHVGNAPGGPNGHPLVSWQYHARSGVPEAVAIVGDQVSFASDDGTVYALDRATGAERWVVHLDGGSPIGPWAADGRLYLIDGAGSPLALDAATGTVLWTAKTAYDGPNEFVIDHGTMYFGTSNGHLVAVDGSTGTEAWNLRPKPSTEWVGNPAVADGKVLAGTSGGFVAVDAGTHQVVWTADTGGDQTGTASANNGTAYIGSGPDATGSHARAFDLATGKLRWTADQPGLTFPIAGDGLVFSSTMEGLVQALDPATGKVRWSIQLSGKIRPMAVASHVLYVPADTEHRLYAIDTATGGSLWQIDLDGGNDCCVAIAHGSAFVSTLAGTVYAIAGDGASIAAQPAATVAPSPTTAAPDLGPVAELPVKQAWSADLRGMGIAPAGQIAVDPTTGRIWVPEAAGNQLAIVDPKTGKVVEEWAGSGTAADGFDFTRQNGDGYGTLAFAPDGSVYVLDVGHRRVLHFDRRRRLVGQWGAFGSGPGQFIDPVGIGVTRDGTVWVLDDHRSVVEHFTPDGKVLGSFDPFATTPNNEGANNLFVDAKDRLYVTGANPSQIYRFDAQGAFVDAVGSGAFHEQAGDLAVDAEGHMFVTQGPQRGVAGAVLVFAPDGTLLGTFVAQGGGDGQAIFPGGVALDGKGGLYLFDTWPDSARLLKFTLPASLR